MVRAEVMIRVSDSVRNRGVIQFRFVLCVPLVSISLRNHGFVCRSKEFADAAI